MKNPEIEDYKDTHIPDFEGAAVYILPGAWYPETVKLFAKAGFRKSDDIEDADLVVFLGGADVSPSFYNETPLQKTNSNLERDMAEKTVFEECVSKEIPMMGICRGAQFLHVMNDGVLWQHVENHAGVDHHIIDLDDDVRILSNSFHHQMVALNDELDVLAVCENQVSKKFEAGSMTMNIASIGEGEVGEIEIEAGTYEKTKTFFVQGHPEVGNKQYQSWVFHKLKEFLVDWDISE